MSGDRSSGSGARVARALFALAFATAFGAAAMALSSACVDGTTPDCSSADAQCGPDGAVSDVSAPDAPLDGPVDGALDATSDVGAPEASDEDSATDGAAIDSGDAAHD